MPLSKLVTLHEDSPSLTCSLFHLALLRVGLISVFHLCTLMGRCRPGILLCWLSEWASEWPVTSMDLWSLWPVFLCRRVLLMLWFCFSFWSPGLSPAGRAIFYHQPVAMAQSVLLVRADCPGPALGAWCCGDAPGCLAARCGRGVQGRPPRGFCRWDGGTLAFLQRLRCRWWSSGLCDLASAFLF